MAKTAKKTRREEVRRNIPRTRPHLRQVVWRRQVMIGGALSLALVACASLLTLHAHSEPDFRPGALVDHSIVTRVPLEWVDKDRTLNRRETVRDQTPSVYIANQDFFERLRQRLIALPETSKYDDISEVAGQLVEQFDLTNQTLDQLEAFQKEGQPTAQWAKLVEGFVSDLYWTPILRSERYDLERAGLAVEVALRVPGQPSRNTGKASLLNLAEKQALHRRIASIGARFPDAIRRSVIAYLVQADQPTFLLDVAATDAAKQAAAAEVRVVRVFAKGEPIIAAGSELTDVDYALLQEEQDRYLASLAPVDRWVYRLSPVGLILLLVVGLIGCVLAMQPRIAQNPLRGLALTSLLAGTLGLAWLIRSPWPYTEAAAAVSSAMLVSVIVAIAYDQRFAMAVGAVHSLMIAVMLELPVGLLLAVLAGCIVAVAQLRQVRQRFTLIRMGVVSGLVVAACVAGAELARGEVVSGAYRAVATQAGWALAAAVVVGFFVLGVLPFIERAFKVTTAMTLLELGDMNHPLLRRLAQQAPGTFNHSLTIATMAESAAEAIGANGLLARVSAYFHDCGKLNKPEYFIENQGGGPNKHAKLSPAMSLLIIVGHVKDGMEMAREYGLPPVIHHFIESHHGTTLVEYFYHAARKRQSEDDQPSEVEFRYPGPKPRTREAAILLLCDSVEAAIRTMPDPNPRRIEQFVHQMAMKRLMDGQFAEAQITLAELSTIEEAITKSLCGVYHGRIAYPSDRDREQGEPDRSPRPVAAG